MTLTLAHGPLSASPPESVNYQITGPEHRLFCEKFPRRVRAVVAGQTIADTRSGRLLHETGLLPQLYIPAADVRSDLLESSDHHTHCPFKGDASYWSLHVGDRRIADAAWEYREPLAQASWLRGHLALDWDAADAWLDEDEEVRGHLRDPYHRVDVRETSRHVRVTWDGTVVAESDRPMLLSETGLPNRYYIPPGDVRRDLLAQSPTRSVCPYKGESVYWSLHRDGQPLADVAWSYPAPLEEATRVREHLSFDHEALAIEVDG